MTEPSEDPEVERARALVGHVLDGKWTLERLLGAGAMGAVYAGRHRNGARGAVKLLHPELARMPEIRERFLREGYAANRVGHRGAVQVLDDDIVKEGEDEGTAYLVMEMLEGEAVEARIERGERLTELELLVIMDQVLEVLEAAHANGVVHRDLKPANLFLAKDDAPPDRRFPYRVKVLDFGLARLDERRMSTRAGLAMGTPSFMAPEQASGRVDEIDGRSDLFALGATAFVLASGKTVHDCEGLLEMVARMATVPARRLRDVAPDISPELAAIVDRALQMARDDRYPTATAMREDVKARLAELSASATAVTEIGSVAAVEGPKSDAPSAASARSTASGARARSSLGTFAVLLLLGAAGVLVFALRADGTAGAASATNALSVADTVAAERSAAPEAPGSPPPDTLSAEAVADDLDDAGVMEELAAGDLDGGLFDDPDAGDDDDEDEDEDEDAGPPAPTASPGSPQPVAHAAAASHTVHKKKRKATPKKKLRPWQKKKRRPRRR